MIKNFIIMVFLILFSYIIIVNILELYPKNIIEGITGNSNDHIPNISSKSLNDSNLMEIIIKNLQMQIDNIRNDQKTYKDNTSKIISLETTSELLNKRLNKINEKLEKNNAN